MRQFAIQSVGVCALLLFLLLPFAGVAEDGPADEPDDTAPIAVPDGPLEELEAFVDEHDRELDRQFRTGRLGPQLVPRAEAVLAASDKILADPVISNEFRYWTLRKRAFAQIVLAYADPAKYYAPLVAAVEDYEAQKGSEKIVKTVETHILQLGIPLATALPSRDNPRPFRLNLDRFVDRLLFFLETYPERESLLLVTQLENRIKAMPPVQRDKMMLTFAERLAPHFLKSSDAADKDRGRNLQATARFLSLPGKPMLLEGVLPSGEDFDSETLKGKVVLVQFWQMTCVPCRAEMPIFVDLLNQFGRSGFAVVGVCTDGGTSAVQNFISRTTLPDDNRITWPVLVDKAATNAGHIQLAELYNITETPVLVLIGRDGNVVRINPAPSALALEVEQALYPKTADDEETER